MYSESEKPPAPPKWVTTLIAAETWGKTPWEITGQSGTLTKKIWIERLMLYRKHTMRAAMMKMKGQAYVGQ